MKTLSVRIAVMLLSNKSPKEKASKWTRNSSMSYWRSESSDRFYYTYEGQTLLAEALAIDASVNYGVIVSGPEIADELLAIVLDADKAIPLFDSVEEAETFLSSTGDFGKD